MSRKSLAGIAVLCLCAGALCSCGRSGTAIQQVSAAQAPAPIVPVAKAARSDMATDVLLTAEFLPYQQIDVMAKVAGYVSSISVDIGDRVREGQRLAVLEIPEMEDDLARSNAAVDQADAEITTARDELSRAQAAHEMAHLSYTRIGDVIRREPGLVPRQDVDEAHSRDLVSEAQVAAAQSSLQTAEQRARVARAERARLETLHKYTAISAPFNGVVTKRYANQGAMIQAGTSSQTQSMPIVQLSQNDLLRLILPVPESVVSSVHVGEEVNVRVTSLGQTFRGRVARFAEKIQESTRTMDTEVDIRNPDLRLIPGMYAEVKLRVEEHAHALVVPLDAVDRSGASPRVYTVAAGVVHIAPVTLGLENAQRVEIASGLDEGTMVVVGRRAGLQEGGKVEARLVEGQVP